MADSKQCLEISLQSSPSQIKASDGRQVPFTRAILTIRNVCGQTVSIALHVTLGQEGGTVQDVTAALSASMPSSIPPNGLASWDVYDLVLPAHQGTASKIHMFGYRAVLNWRFDVAARATYSIAGASESMNTSTSRWSLKWTIVNPTSGSVGLSIEEIKA